MVEPHADPADLSALHDGELSPAAEETVRRHLEACDRCRSRADEFAELDRSLDDLAREAERRALAVSWPVAVPRSPRRWPLVATAAAIALVATVAWRLGEPGEPAPALLPERPLRCEGDRVFELPDGSVVEAGGGALIRFADDPGGRHVVLEEGAVLCRVRPADRPFVVHTPAARIQVLGTVFTIDVKRRKDVPKVDRRNAAEGGVIAGSAVLAVVTVAVLQGSVHVQNPSGERIVRSGETVVVQVETPAESARVDAPPGRVETDAAAFEEGRARLREAAAETYRLHVEYQEESRNRRYQHLVGVLDRMAEVERLAEQIQGSEENPLAVPGAAEVLGELARIDDEEFELLLFEIETSASPRREGAIELLGMAVALGYSGERTRGWAARLVPLALDGLEPTSVRVAALGAVELLEHGGPPAWEGLDASSRSRLLALLEATEPAPVRRGALDLLDASSDSSVRDHLGELSRIEADGEFAEALREAAIGITERIEGKEAAEAYRAALTR